MGRPHRRRERILTGISPREVALLEAYIVRNLSALFPSHQLVSTDKLLLGNRTVDLHLRNEAGNDVFVEVKASSIGRSEAGELVDYYSAIANLEPEPKNFRFIVVGEGIDEELRGHLEKLNVSFVSLGDLGISISKLLEDDKERRRRTLTPMEAKLVLSWEAKKPKVIDVAFVAEGLGCTRNYADVLLHRLQKKGWVERIAKGVYTFIPAGYGYEERFPAMNPFLVGSNLVSPYYFSYATANAHYGFTTQMPSTYYIATTKKKPSSEWRNIGFRFVTLTKGKFFGFRQEALLGVRVNMAEPEKALVDSLDKIRDAGGIEEVVGAVYRGWGRVDREKLTKYALGMKIYALCQRLGFIIDFLAAKGFADFPSSLRGALLKAVGRAPVYLNPSGDRRGSFSREWRVIKNLEDRQLLSEVETV